MANRLYTEWENSDYVILKGGTGSGAWINIVLPFERFEKVKMFDNMLYFDPESNIVAYQYFSIDTVLVVESLKTEQKQFIVLSDTRCGAASNLYCMDSVIINDNELYFKWATPYLSSDSSRIFEEKRFPIKIK